MANIMVCVTKQKNCNRLIEYGKTLAERPEDGLHIVHVTGSDYTFLGDSEDGKALTYLYEKSREAGADLTVLKSDDVLETLCNTVKENKINTVVVGASKEVKGFDGFLQDLENKLQNQAKLVVVPAGGGV